MNKKGDVSMRTIVTIIIVLATLVVLLLIVYSQFDMLMEIWEKSPFGG